MLIEHANACRERQLQYFWEVFPAQDGITTYMFAYTDPTPGMSHQINSLQQCCLGIAGKPDQQCITPCGSATSCRALSA